MTKKFILIGLGNPIMSDDRVGIIVAQEVKKRLPDLDLDTACYGSLEVVDRISGYEKAFIIDSMVTDRFVKGTVRRVDPGVDVTLNCGGSHGVSLSQAIEIARACGSALPPTILIYGIEVSDPFTVGDAMSEELNASLDSIVESIVEDIGREV